MDEIVKVPVREYDPFGKKETFRYEQDYSKREPRSHCHVQPETGWRASVQRFATQNKEIVSKLRIIAVMLILALVWSNITAARVRKETTEALNIQHQKEITAAVFIAEQDTIARIKKKYNINDEEMQQKSQISDAQWIASMLEPYAEAGNTDEALYMIAFSAKNREKSARYPNDMESVVKQEAQYMNPPKEIDYTDRTYKIALDVCVICDTTGAPMSKSFVHVWWSPREVKLLDNLEKNIPTHTYYETDMRDFLRARSEAAQEEINNAA